MKSLDEKLNRIADLAMWNAEPEFDGCFFQRKLAEMLARRIDSAVQLAKPAGYELPAVPRQFRQAA